MQDRDLYLGIAGEMRAGHGFATPGSDPPRATAFRPPLYPLLLVLTGGGRLGIGCTASVAGRRDGRGDGLGSGAFGSAKWSSRLVHTTPRGRDCRARPDVAPVQRTADDGDLVQLFDGGAAVGVGL